MHLLRLTASRSVRIVLRRVSQPVEITGVRGWTSAASAGQTLRVLLQMTCTKPMARAIAP